ncbi:uncharacterized protein LOC128878571 [Hylaeus volcanicus]|uniref:uncharacterized protein LOC128878571 n=1 Tax=Hylaeus volcanicus TaxID=313075 RepID=UPI0023B7A42F|nr:uncharacterized protein LOC128878571 [Hylaeus volcanicus]
MSGRRDSTCQKNDLPKSLHGAEDAEMVWSMITERFPNAAPLLCEMEAVVDRAEDLLMQLRAPCQREIETSTSFCTPDLEESTLMISARGSLSTENDVRNPENDVDRNVAGTQISNSTVDEEDVNSNSHKNFIFRNESVDMQSSESSTMQRSTGDKFSTAEESASSKIDTHVDQRMKEARSLEEWSKVVDNAMRKSIIGEDQVHKEAVTVDRKSNKVEEHKIESDIANVHEKSCIVLHRQRRCADIDNVGDSMIDIDSDLNVASQELIETKDDTVNVSLQGSGDESSPKFGEQNTPLNILEGYSKRCKVPVKYEYVNDGIHRHKSNVFVIRGSLGEFAAPARGESEETAKNSLATTLLQMIANHQMNDGKLSNLLPLSDEEMLEIIRLGTDSPRETPQRKLYQICLETGQSVPKYCVEKVKTYQGFTYVATCTALGYTCEGRGIRECGAKKSAADEVYRQYCLDQKAGAKIKDRKTPRL